MMLYHDLSWIQIRQAGGARERGHKIVRMERAQAHTHIHLLIYNHKETLQLSNIEPLLARICLLIAA